MQSRKLKIFGACMALLFSHSLSNAQLIKVIDQNDAVQFQKILSKTDIEKINQIDKNTAHTPLTRALSKGNSLFAKMLIDKGADVKLNNGNGDSPLYYAVDNKDLELAKIILSKGADVNTTDKYKGTPLHLAAKNCDTAMISLLLSFKANVNAVDDYGNTPLTESMSKDQPPIGDSTLYMLIGDYYILSDNKPSGRIEVHDTLVKHLETLNIKLSEKDGKKYIDEFTLYERYVPATCQLLAAGAKVCPHERGAKHPYNSIYGTKHLFHKMLLYRYSRECLPEDSIVKGAIESSLIRSDPFFPGIMLRLGDRSVVQSLNQPMVINTILNKISKMASEKNYNSYDYSSTRNYDFDPILCREYYDVLCKLFDMGLQDKDAQIVEWGRNAINSGYSVIFKDDIYKLMLLSSKSGSNPNIVLDSYFKTPYILWLTHQYGYSRLDKKAVHYLTIFKIIESTIENGASLDPAYDGNDSHYSNDWTPLSHAINDESEDLIRLYLSKGAKMDVAPVKRAFFYAPDPIKKILLDAGYTPQ